MKNTLSNLIETCLMQFFILAIIDLVFEVYLHTHADGDDITIGWIVAFAGYVVIAIFFISEEIDDYFSTNNKIH